MKHSVRGVFDEATTLRFVEGCLACYQTLGVGPWALIEKDTSALIGFCGVGPEQIGDVEEINPRYRLARRHLGKGIATESAHAVVAYAFGTLAFDSVVVIIEPEHAASLQVAEKARFHKFQDLAVHEKQVRLYRLTRDDWTQSHNTPLQTTSGRDAAFLDRALR
jgi:[ribosomal protein S5]-alanine N-acetyltransferase